jgi:3-phenylpropionate/trans-cinnamate dioxygenase ferredoxin component
MPEYQRIGSVEDFEEGVMRPYQVGARDIAVVKVGERFYAFDNFCTHEAVTFTSGYGLVAKQRVICMLHSSAFDIETGDVLTGPAPDPLEIYDVQVEGSDVLVGIPDGAPSSKMRVE